MYRRAVRLNLIVVAALASAACAGPITQVGSVSLDDVRAEQSHQQQLAARSALLAQQRVDRLVAPLLRAAAPLCGRDVRVAARATVTNKSEGFATPTADTLCAYVVGVAPDDAVKAHADGLSIVVSSALLRFTDDEELSVVLAHELAHNAMRHADAMKRNASTGGILGAVADPAATGGGNTGGELAKQGAAAGAMAFSQEFEREADYVGLYILAWAGRSIDDAAQIWRRLAAEHPAGITFAYTHPTTAERFVRLEQWRSEINRKIASGMDFGPDMRDRRFAVVRRAAAPTELFASTSPAVHDSPVPRSAASVHADVRQSSMVLELPTRNDSFARATIGAPLSEADRSAAVPAYEQAVEFLGSHRWGQAKAKLREALRYDGSVAAYHAAMGEVLEVEKDWAGAAAEYTAALLLDVDNTTYRVRLKEARFQLSSRGPRG